MIEALGTCYEYRYSGKERGEIASVLDTDIKKVLITAVPDIGFECIHSTRLSTVTI